VRGAEGALRGADELERIGCERAVSEGNAVELLVDEVEHVVGGEALHQDGVGDGAVDVVVDAEGELVEQLGLSERG
jgi:hypothetical protein